MRQTMMKLVLVSLVMALVPAASAAQQAATVQTPLVIVDGIVIGSSTALDALGRVPPSDIMSIDVIKGAVAMELYGARASGGVIMIRTKSGPNSAALTEQQREWTE